VRRYINTPALEADRRIELNALSFAGFRFPEETEPRNDCSFSDGPQENLDVCFAGMALSFKSLQIIDERLSRRPFAT